MVRAFKIILGDKGFIHKIHFCKMEKRNLLDCLNIMGGLQVLTDFGIEVIWKELWRNGI
jgi:hypothetical protein